MANLLTWIRLPVFIGGAALLFIADRYLGQESYFLAVRIAALLLMALGLAFTFVVSVAAGKVSKGEAKAWRYVMLWQLTFLVGIGCYFAYRQVLGDAATPDKLPAKLLLGAWLVLTALGAFAGIGLEWAMKEGGRGPLAEPNRVVRSGSAWLVVGMLLCTLFGINYAADKKDKVRDWSYLKVTTPSETTQKMIATTTQDVTIALFYPQGNEVRTLVSQYFDTIASKEPRIKVTYFDKDMNPTQAESYRVSRNGQIVFDVGGKRSRIDTGTELAKARKTLKTLDAEFQKAFLEITAEKKTVYFTRGHGESSWVGDAAQNQLKSLSLLEAFLRQQNYSVRLFGVAEGSATAVPDDAAAVVVVGPTQPFQKEEVEALKTYVEKGGNLMVFADIDRDKGELAPATETPDPLHEYLAAAGLKLNDQPLANDKNFVSATRSPSDAWFIFTNIFTSHDSVVSLARHDERIAVLFYQGGSVKVTPQSGQWKAFETVRTLSDTFVDENRNFKFDQGEKRDSYVVGAVAEWQGNKDAQTKDAPKGGKDKKKNSRIVVFTDASGLSDALVRNPGNAVFFADSLKWLVGESELAGQPASEEDVKIRHTRKEDVIWFHGTVIVVPLLVLGAGFFATRRKRAPVNNDDKPAEVAGGAA